MNTLNCEFVRESLADVLHGQAPPELAAAINRHVHSCAECQAELRTVQALLAEPVVVPASLEARVLTELRAPTVPRREIRWRWAAIVTFALLGGAVLVRAMQEQQSESLVVRTDESGLGVIGVEGALVSGSATLRDLSIEELEQLLGEMES